jgi:hypothetical protein
MWGFLCRNSGRPRVCTDPEAFLIQLNVISSEIPFAAIGDFWYFALKYFKGKTNEYTK